MAADDQSQDWKAAYRREDQHTAEKAGEIDMIILPSGDVGLAESARMAFERIAKSETLFFRGGGIVEVSNTNEGFALALVSATAMRSKIERFGPIAAWRVGAHGEHLLKIPARLSQDTAKVYLESDERRLLPVIHGLCSAPVIVSKGGDVELLGKGYHAESGLLVTGGESVPEMPVEEAVKVILDLLVEFDFATPADRSRAVALLLAPALKLGGLLRAHCPAGVVEADDSQAGKGFLVEIIQSIYRERPTIITQKNGGVGGFDESLAQAMIAGRPFIQFDNVRGKLSSTFLEAVLTCPMDGTVGARVPYQGEIEVEPVRFLFFFTSNGFESTRDLANRSCIVRLRKRRGHAFRKFHSGDLLDHVTTHQANYLGAVLAIASAWHRQGRQATSDLRGQGRFRHWSQTLDWIVQNLFGLPPLLDGHEDAQERASNPAQTWLRQLALVIEAQAGLGIAHSASRLLELSADAGLLIPGVQDGADEKRAQLAVGRIMGQLFRNSSDIIVDVFRVTRSESVFPRDDGRGDFSVKGYAFTRD